ncbi:MAG: hypothetical protein AAGA48_13790 [Myxococcota bacterium]
MSDDPAAELTEALRLWRRTRDPRLERIIAELGRIASEPVALLPPGSLKAHTAWIAHAMSGRDTQVEALLETLCSSRVEEAVERLDVLWQRGADPRIVAAAQRWVERPPYAKHRERFEALVERVLREGLPHGTNLAEVAARRFGPVVGPRAKLARQIMAIRSEAVAPTALPPDAEAQVVAWGRRFDDANPMEAVLIDAIVANPNEDEPREVLADLWIQQGNPRGAFTRRQLQGRWTYENHRLVLRHGKDWFGATLVASTRHLRPCRGFLDTLTIERLTYLEALVDSPALRTVRRLHLPPAAFGGPRMRDFLTSSNLPNLRSLGSFSVHDRHWIAEACPQLEAIQVDCTFGWLDDDRTLSDAQDLFPRLRRIELTISPTDVHQVAAVKSQELCLWIRHRGDPNGRVDQAILKRMLEVMSPEVERVFFFVSAWEPREDGVWLVKTDQGFGIDLARPPAVAVYQHWHSPTRTSLPLLAQLDHLPLLSGLGEGAGYHLGIPGEVKGLRTLDRLPRAPVVLTLQDEDVDAVRRAPIEVVELTHVTSRGLAALADNPHVQHLVLRGFPFSPRRLEVHRTSEGFFRLIRGSATALASWTPALRRLGEDFRYELTENDDPTVAEKLKAVLGDALREVSARA